MTKQKLLDKSIREQDIVTFKKLYKDPEIDIAIDNNHLVRIASEYDNFEIFHLLATDPRVNLEPHAEHALSIAAQYGFVQHAKYLLDNNLADPTTENNNPLLLANHFATYDKDKFSNFAIICNLLFKNKKVRSLLKINNSLLYDKLKKDLISNNIKEF